MPHVMPKWYRDNPGLVDEKTKQNRDDHADLERREFIREAAIALYANGWNAEQGLVAWGMAINLWNTKPEDC
jgi:ribose 1,5-bisphosphokinase PhnN